MKSLTSCMVFIAILGCKSNSAKNNSSEVVMYTPDFKTNGPPALVYKTKTDYFNLVPIILSDDKSSIVSYPHPSDLKSGDNYLTPTVLKNGYLLDNRGIGKNVAFIKLTYQEYGNLKEQPSLDELYALIIDKDPLTELCNCGNKLGLTHPAEQLNSLIDSGKLRTSCLPIK